MDLINLHTWISRVFLGVLNFENLYFFGYWSELLSDKCCIFKCLTFSTVLIFLGPVLFTRYFSKHISSLLSSHTQLLLNESGLGRVSFKVSLFGKYFIGFFFSWKYFLGRSAIPNSADPCLLVCQVHFLGFKISVRSRSQFFNYVHILIFIYLLNASSLRTESLF